MSAVPRRNLERKYLCPDLGAVRAALRPLAPAHGGILVQADVYFHSRAGRLKLRTTDGAGAELIAYDRPDETAARLSAYFLVPVADPVALEAALGAALGVRGVVRKRRELWLWHNVRIHLDAVQDLGEFVEFEAVLGEGETEEAARRRLAELERRLSLAGAECIAGSYADLLGI